MSYERTLLTKNQNGNPSISGNEEERVYLVEFNKEAKKEGKDNKSSKGSLKNLYILLIILFVLLIVASYAMYELIKRDYIINRKDDYLDAGSEFHIKSFYSYPYCGRKICNTGPCKTRIRKLVGGIESTLGSWPWMADITVNGDHVCGGTLINRRYVITAAHCLYNGGDEVDSININIFLGSLHRNLPETTRQKHSICNYIVHELFNRDTLENDIALMKLKKPVDFNDNIAAACLPKIEDFNDGVMTGWGKYAVNGPFTPSLKEALVPVIPYKNCSKSNDQIYRRVKVNKDKHICVGFGKDSKEYACEGDSGGGFYQKKGSRWYVQGLISWIDPSCNSTLRDSFTILTKVTSFDKWLGDRMELDFLES